MGADVYQRFLGIDPAVPRPLTIYNLLGLANFEANTALIRQRLELQKRRLAGFPQSEYQPAIAKLQELLVKAEQVFQSPELRARYDTKLRSHLATLRTAEPLQASAASAGPPSLSSPTAIPPLPSQAFPNQPISPLISPPTFAPPPVFTASNPFAAPAPNAATTPASFPSATTTPNLAKPLKKKPPLAKQPLFLVACGLASLLLAGIAIWAVLDQKKPLAQRQPAAVPETNSKTRDPATVAPSPPDIKPLAQPEAIKPLPPPEPELDPRRAGKILCTGAVTSEYELVEDELRVSKTKAPDEFFVFGDDQWRDYDFEFDCRFESNNSSICPLGIVIRCPDNNVLGAMRTIWDPQPRVQVRVLERLTSDQRYLAYSGSNQGTRYRKEFWQTFKISVRDQQVIVRLNNEIISDQRVEYLPHRGKVGFHIVSPNSFITQLRNIRVTDPTGKELWSGLPNLDRDFTPLRMASKRPNQSSGFLDPAKTPRLAVPENAELVYRFDGRKDGWVSPPEIPEAETYWFIEDQKLTHKIGQKQGFSSLRLDQPPLKNLVIKARLEVLSEAVNIAFRAPLQTYQERRGISFYLAREGTSGLFRYPGKNSEDVPPNGTPPKQSFDLELIAADDCLEALIDGKTLNLYRIQDDAPKVGSIWISAQGPNAKTVIHDFQVWRLPDSFRRLTGNDQQTLENTFVWKYEGGQFERYPNGSWVETNEQGERRVYLEKLRNDYSITLESLDGNLRVRLQDADIAAAAIPFKDYRFHKAGRFIGPGLRQVPPADKTLTPEAARAIAVISTDQQVELQSVLQTIEREQAEAKQKTALLFQTYAKGIGSLVDYIKPKQTQAGTSELRDHFEGAKRDAQLAKIPHYLIMVPDTYEFNVPLLRGNNETQNHLKTIYEQQITQLRTEGKTVLADRLQEMQRNDVLVKPWTVCTIRYTPTPLQGDVLLDCLSDFTVAGHPQLKLTWEYANAKEIIIQEAAANGKTAWRDTLRMQFNGPTNPVLIHYGNKKQGVLYSVYGRRPR